MKKRKDEKTTSQKSEGKNIIGTIKAFAKEWEGVITILSLVVTFIALPINIGKWCERLDNVEERVEAFAQWNTSIGEVQKSVASMETSIINIFERVARIETHEDNILSLKLSENANIDIEPVGSSELHFASWEDVDENVVVGTDNNNAYTIKEIAGRTVFIPYRNDDNTLLFYGQLSNKQNWDGLCLLNGKRSIVHI